MSKDKKYKISVEKLEELKKEINRILNPYIKRVIENLTRIYSLIATFEHLKENTPGMQLDDMLRAAVVLLHATLEDFLRVLAVSVIPEASNDVLNSIPLAGMSRYGRQDKFSLGDLAKHKGKNVDTIIKESVNSYLERESFNNIEDIVLLLKNIRVDTEDIKIYFSDIDAMIKRRHQIVHRADRIYKGINEEEPLDNIVPATVNNWVSAVQGFITAVISKYGVEKGIKMFVGVAEPVE